MPIIGHNSGNDSVQLGGACLWFCTHPVVAPADGTLGSVTFKLFVPAMATFRFGIYSDDSGHPGTLLAQTELASFIDQAGSEHQLPLTSPLAVVQGQKLWIAMSQSAQAFLYYTPGAGGAMKWIDGVSLPSTAPATLNAFPAPPATGSAWAYATYGSSALQSGIASLSADSDAVHLQSAAPFGGTPPYSFEWHRSGVSGFMPGPSTLIGTTQNFDDPTAVLSYYKLRTLDSASVAAVSGQLAGQRLGPVLKIGAIGDSFYAGSGLAAGQNIAARCAHYLALSTGRTVTLDNRGVGGTRTTDWLPSGTLLPAAAASFAAGGVELVNLMLGANDAIAPNRTPPATYAANLSAICAHLLANVPTLTKIVPHHPTYIPPETATDETAVALTHEYRAAIAGLVGGSIHLGDTLATALIANNCRAGTPDNLLADDRIHLNVTGADYVGLLQASA